MKTGWMVMAMVAAVSVARAEPKASGPSGGRMLDSSPRVEFFVNGERKVEVRLWDEQLKPLPLSSGLIGVIAQAPSGKTTLNMEAKADALVSTAALPEGDGYTVVVQVRATADSKPQNFRIPLHMENCGGCQRAEYACTCDHAEEGSHEGHGH